MSDPDDAYAVVGSSQWLLAPATQSEQIYGLLDYIKTAFAPERHAPQEHASTLCAVKTAAGALAVSGGHIVVIECTPPMLGIGRISSQENAAFYGTDDESQLYVM